MSRIAVLGLGLIGGSVAQGLARTHDVIGFDPDRSDSRTGRLAFAATPEEAVDGADVVVLAAPVPANDDLLALVPGTAVVTDVGSVKAPIAAAWQHQRLVPGHPMAGAETAGWEAATPDLFTGARWALCPGPWASREDFLTVCALVLELGAVVVPVDPVEHDAAVARISHAPHLVAAALASSADTGDHPALTRTLAAGSFRDLTRITASPPARTAEFVFANRGQTAGVLRELAQALTETADALEDRDRLQALLAAGHTARQQVDGATRRGPQQPLVLDGPDWWEPLLDVGRAGGLVHAVDGSTLTVTFPED